MEYIRKTKIVCTIGPGCDNEDVLRNVILAGMNVARFNFSHGTHADHKVRVDLVKRISKELDIPVALMLDTKGPEIRTGLVEDNGVVSFNKGDLVNVASDGGFTTAAGAQPGHISLTLADIAERVTEGVKILIADGVFELDVIKTDGKTILCRAANSAKIGNRKNVNLIGIHSGLPIIGDQDKADIIFAAEQDMDLISASFLSFPTELIEIRDFLRTIRYNAKIIAKIESNEGLENIEKITALADGVMVARGDLAVQIPDETIPIAQKHIIEVARRYCKPVITATQMLDSMISNPRPTRAELTDVANAIFDGSDAVMLSGETANGAYPVEAVRTMSKICTTVEQSTEFKIHIRNSYTQLMKNLQRKEDSGNIISNVISRGAYETAYAVNAKVILTPTSKGSTARQISMYRPEQVILAVTPDERTMRSLLLVWGVIPKLTKQAMHSDEMIQNALKISYDTGLANISDKIVLAAGMPLQSPLPLNTIRVLILGTILARSISGGHSNENITRANGRIVWADDADNARRIIKSSGGDILVCPVLTEDYIPILRIVTGVICEGDCNVSDEVLSMVNSRLVWLTGVHNAASELESGLSVTIDAKAFLVYEGTI